MFDEIAAIDLAVCPDLPTLELASAFFQCDSLVSVKPTVRPAHFV